MKVTAIVQARLGSSRLPNKMLLEIAGATVLEQTLRRIPRREIDEVILATTTLAQDRSLIELAGRLGVRSFAGNETDVLDRYYRAAQSYGTSVIVRLTGDCPVHDQEVIDLVVRRYLERVSDIDYVSNVTPPTFPDGLDVEVFSFELLERMWREATAPADREHVTTYVRTRLGQFRTLNVTHDGEDLSGLRWTLDEPVDLDFLRWVFASLNGHDDFTWRDILTLVRDNPDPGRLNRKITRNEGWMVSMMKDTQPPGSTYPDRTHSGRAPGS